MGLHCRLHPEALRPEGMEPAAQPAARCGAGRRCGAKRLLDLLHEDAGTALCPLIGHRYSNGAGPRREESAGQPVVAHRRSGADGTHRLPLCGRLELHGRRARLQQSDGARRCSRRHHHRAPRLLPHDVRRDDAAIYVERRPALLPLRTGDLFLALPHPLLRTDCQLLTGTHAAVLHRKGQKPPHHRTAARTAGGSLCGRTLRRVVQGHELREGDPHAARHGGARLGKRVAHL